MLSKITTEQIEHRQLRMTVEVDQARVDQEMRKAARKLGGKYRIPGFRQGKAPFSVLVQYVGMENLYNEFAEELGQEAYMAAIEQESIEPYAVARLDVSGVEPLTYVFEIPLDPEVDLGDYRSLRVEEEEQTVDEEEVQTRIDVQREQYAAWTDVDRPSQYGDRMTIDVRSVLVAGEGDEDADETIVLDEKNWEVTPDDENPMEPPGFDEELLGLSVGDDAEFELDWPEDSQSIYAGRTAQFSATVHQIQSYEMPEVNDDLAQLIGPDFETVEDLVESVREDLLVQKVAQAENVYLTEVLDTLVEQSTLDYPPAVVEDQIDVMLNQTAQQLRSYGIEDIDGYFEQTGQNTEEYRETLREQAEITAQRNLVISEIYRLEGIEVSDEQIEERIAGMMGEDEDETTAASNKAIAETMRSDSGRAILESQILQEEALKRLLAIARGEELPELPAVSEEDDGEVSAPGTVDDTSETDEPVNETNSAEVDDEEDDDAVSAASENA